MLQAKPAEPAKDLIEQPEDGVEQAAEVEDVADAAPTVAIRIEQMGDRADAGR